MSDCRNRRNLPRFDYSEIHKTGKHVAKTMPFYEQILLEGKIVEDINDFFKVYELRELTLENEISEGLESATQYGKNYRDVHIELKMGLDRSTKKDILSTNKLWGIR